MKTVSPVCESVVHVVDDDDSFRRAILRLLKAAGFTAREYASAGEFVLELPLTTPGCLILDVRMPGPSGLDLQEALARRAVHVPIIFLSGHGDIPMSVRAMKAGAVDFLTKPVKRETLLAAVRSALNADAGARAVHEKQRQFLESYAKLTPREKEVFALVTAGKLNKQAAAELGVAERTVKLHRAHVMEKMGVRSLAGLVHAAERIGIDAGHPV